MTDPVNKIKFEWVRLMFTIISVLLLVPAIHDGNNAFLSTLFIFLINQVSEFFFYDNQIDHYLIMNIWRIINGLVGILVCALSFCLMNESFFNLFANYDFTVKGFLFGCALSVVLEEAVEFFVIVVSQKSAEYRIRSAKKEVRRRIGL